MMAAAAFSSGSPTSDAGPKCPPGCTEFHDQHAAEVLHQHDVLEVWESPGGESTGLALTRFDDQDGPGSPVIEMQFSEAGNMVSGSVPLSLQRARGYAEAILRLVEMAESGWR